MRPGLRPVHDLRKVVAAGESALAPQVKLQGALLATPTTAALEALP